MKFDTAGITVTIEDQVRAVEREIAMRQSVYGRRVDAGQMTVLRARQEIAAMEAVLATVRRAEEAGEADLMALKARDLTDLAAKHRSACKLLTLLAQKGRKGEGRGYLTATLYLMPHTSGGGVSLCPHSTEACREMCLAGAGMSALPRQMRAKQNRTSFFLDDLDGFIDVLRRDLLKLVSIAAHEDVKLAIRLNGTSDVIWERVAPKLLAEFDYLTFYDYTKVPIEKRLGAPHNYHLTYSVGEETVTHERAIAYLRAGLSVAAVVPAAHKDWIVNDGRPMILGRTRAAFVDGDADDLRFLDPPSSIVLLKPKGHVRTALIRPNLIADLTAAAMADAGPV